MKTLILILFLIICSSANSQIHYVEVYPKTEKQYEHKEGYFNNASAFNFSVREYFSYKKCIISGYLSDPSLENIVKIFTGWDFEYTEAVTKADSTGYFEAIITTNNLPKILLVVFYMGEPVSLKLENVDIYFSGSKY